MARREEIQRRVRAKEWEGISKANSNNNTLPPPLSAAILLRRNLRFGGLLRGAVCFVLTARATWRLRTTLPESLWYALPVLALALCSPDTGGLTRLGIGVYRCVVGLPEKSAADFRARRQRAELTAGLLARAPCCSSPPPGLCSSRVCQSLRASVRSLSLPLPHGHHLQRPMLRRCLAHCLPVDSCR